MSFLKLKKVLIFLILGCFSSIILMFFELRYLFSDKDMYLDHVSPGFIIILISQSIFFTMIFLAATLSIKYMKKDFHERNPLKYLDSIGLALQLISIFLVLSIFSFPYGIYILAVISFTLLCLGLILYRQTKNDLSKSFVLWGIAILILLYLLTSISFSYLSSWS